MLLENKNAVIHGGGGAIGGAVARAFAREGARDFLTDRNRENLETVAKRSRRPVGPPRSLLLRGEGRHLEGRRTRRAAGLARTDERIRGAEHWSRDRDR